MPNYQAFVAPSHISPAVGAGTAGGFVPNFADNETPTGTVNGINTVFTLAHTPNPAASLDLFKNGQLLIASGVDFTLATATVTFTAGSIPQTGDAIICSYRF